MAGEISADGATAEVGAPPTFSTGPIAKGRMPVPGERLGRYELIEQLGAGGMGVVFRARDPDLDRDVAVKLLRSTGPGDDGSQGRARLVREARAMAAIRHPNVIEVYDVGLVGDAVFFAMELVEGTTLKGWVQGEKPGWREILAAFDQAGRGLQAAHAQGLVHRDFKPDNVLVDVSGGVAVTDFGIASADASVQAQRRPSSEDAGSFDSYVTAAGAVLGTPAYMSPEQHKGEVADGRSDQFGFCVALWEALYGQRPFAGRRAREVRKNLFDGRLEPPPPGTAVPRRVELVIRRGLEFSSERRWPTMHALLAQLERAARPRRGWWVAGGLLAMALPAAVVLPRSDAAGGPCTRLQQLEPARTGRHEGMQGFEAAAGAQGRETWTDVASRLDAYAVEWKDTRSRLCSDGVAAPREVAARAACLEEALARYETVRLLFDRPDAETVERAQQTVAGLDTPASCNEAASDDALPKDPELAASVGELRRALARVETLESAGRYAEALREASDVLARAADVGFAPVHADAMYREARLLEFAGEYERSKSRLEATAWYALEHGRDQVAAHAIAELVFVLAVRHRDISAALQWADRAEPVLARLGRRTQVGAWLGHNKAIAYGLDGRLEDARRAHEAALAIQEEVLDPDSTDLAAARLNLSNVLLRLGELDQAQESLERALEIYERVSGPEHPDTAMVLAALGKVLARTGDSVRARSYMERAEKVWRQTLAPGHQNLIVLQNNLGALAFEDGRYDEARRRYRRALESAQRQFDEAHPDVAMARNNLADVSLALGDYEEAENGYARSLETFGYVLDANDPKLGVPIHGLAKVALARGQLARAQEHIGEAIALFEGRGGRDGEPNLLPSAQATLAEIERAVARGGSPSQ